MGWDRRYATKSYLRSALWTPPLIALVLEQIAVHILTAVEIVQPWIPRMAATPAAMISVMDTVITLSISFLVFTFGSMLVAIQVAGGQMTPRIIATALLRDNPIRVTVGLFVFTMLFALGTRARSEVDVPHLAFGVAVVFGFASVTAFLFLIDYTARLLRPITMVWRIAEDGIRVIERVYPDLVGEPNTPRSAPVLPDGPMRIVEHEGKSAVLLAINDRALIEYARGVNGVVELMPRVGDFVTVGEPLFRLHGNSVAINDRTLREQVAFGPERTIEQDALFAFRVIADIAIKALSQAINDPTTAVISIDQLHRLLRWVGRRRLHDDSICDANGALRLIVRTPNWEDFIQLAFSEIRLYGAGNFQVARRLRAMIENLSISLPEVRRPALQCELQALDRALEQIFRTPEDLVLARQADMQGLGGSSLRPS